MSLDFAVTTYRAIRDRIRAQDPEIDERTLADTVEGLTDLHQIVEAIVRSALQDEALATGLKGRIAEMEDRLARLQDRASKRRQIAKDVMVELDLKKLQAPDFTASIRPGTPALMVIDEAAVPSIYWEPRDPRLNRQGLLAERRRQRRRVCRRQCPDLAPGPIDKSKLKIAEPKRLRDKLHLKFVASQPCLVCGRQPSDPHHLRFAQSRALGIKVSDEFTVPLCRGHHRQLHQAGNEVAWWNDRKLNALEVARELWERNHPILKSQETTGSKLS